MLFRAACVVAALALTLAVLWKRQHERGRIEADEHWKSAVVEPLGAFGATEHLAILPLMNWHADREDLRTEAGVSYLVRTDENTLLFDLGFNRNEESPSPLEFNMRALGIELEAIDTLFLSHHHFDHVGGRTWVSEDSFSLGNIQVKLSGKRVFAPAALRYPGVETAVIDRPAVIGPGLASIGPIRRQLAFGPIDEQALAINLAGKGIVLLVGCGHQTLERILARARAVFDAPVYGVVGDLHYPLPEGRLNVLGLNLQHRFASGRGPLDPLTPSEIEADLQLLATLEPGIVALGGHDTSDGVIGRAESLFGERYRRVRVGQWIEFP